MKHALIVGIIIGVVVGLILSPLLFPPAVQVKTVTNTVTNTVYTGDVLGVYFSPNGECENQVINWINKANSTIYILIYSFTLNDISNALINAYHRNVTVKIVFEPSQISQYSEYNYLKSNGISCKNSTNSHLMHNKVMIVDGMFVLTGSFNWSTDAQTGNNENLIVIQGNETASTYQNDFWQIWNNQAK